ncbi:uncharacterized membrane protein (DUF485 family) [Methylopila capsulata]|uniref:Uncharacterized membrane protein (DUF485 family) n=1 Tax=Methylopila capsulata TaxID=61654 RepID=A0A9W6IWT7_9HYPH|nr:DUF485 domain-containing protein [Methylopila capsulata]MBM7852401.1 uncharacterized membrane protein (DUF485 family) [Methylopila capsulata]GLK56610.1 hypothetical protein GCM10008170_26290 [Methylopila capsulata]
MVSIEDAAALPVEVDEFVRLSRRRSRVAVALSAAMIAMYFGFMAMFAFAKPVMGTMLAPGLSLSILLGAGVIVGSFLFCLVYVVWANRFYDPAVRRILS